MGAGAVTNRRWNSRRGEGDGAGEAVSRLPIVAKRRAKRWTRKEARRLRVLRFDAILKRGYPGPGSAWLQELFSTGQFAAIQEASRKIREMFP